MGWTALQDGWTVNSKGNLRRQSIRQADSRETDGQVDRLGDWRCQGLLGTPRDRRATKGGFKRENSGDKSCEGEGPELCCHSVAMSVYRVNGKGMRSLCSAAHCSDLQ